MDQRQPQTDRQRAETGRRALGGGAQNDDQEHRRHNDFRHQNRRHGIALRRQFAEPVGGKPTRTGKARLTRGDQVEHQPGRHRAHHLCDPVRHQILGLVTPRHDQPQRHRRIEMTAGNVTHGIGHGQDRQTECQADTQPANSNIGHTGGQHGTAAAAQNQPECADKFGNEFLGHSCSPSLSRLEDTQYLAIRLLFCAISATGQSPLAQRGTSPSNCTTSDFVLGCGQIALSCPYSTSNGVTR